MARKRGGLAGFYDRNKGAIKTIAPIAAGFVPVIGPALGAGIGAAIGGLDREGKSGIGLDLGGALKGGISGYGGAKIGQAAKGGLAKMFTGGVPGQSALKLPSATSVMPEGLSSNIVGGSAAASPAASGGFNAAQYMADDLAAQVPSKAFTLGKGVTTNNPLVRASNSITSKIPSALKSKEGLGFAGSALQTGANIMGSQAQAAQAAQEYEDQQRRLQAQAEMMALFAPQMAGNLGMSNFMPQGASLRGNSAMSMQDYMGASYALGSAPSMADEGGYAGNYQETPSAQRTSAAASAAGRDYMATGFGGSDRARQLAEEAAARGRAYTYGRR